MSLERDGRWSWGPGMRTARLTTALLLASLPVAVRADGATLTMEATTELRVGARTSIPLLLHWEGTRPVQIMLSAHAEGRALDVVKGRLLRADAIDPDANPLRFELPVVAAAPGVALLTVTALTYPCQFRCEAKRTEASQQILVREL